MNNISPLTTSLRINIVVEVKKAPQPYVHFRVRGEIWKNIGLHDFVP